MNTSTIRQLAEREHQAEQNKESAEKVWRAAWWETTLALGVVNGGQGEVSAALHEVSVALDYKIPEGKQFASRALHRRRIGQRVDLTTVGGSKINSVPPEMAREWSDAGNVIDAAAIDRMLQLDAEGKGKRDLMWEIAEEGGPAVRPSMRRMGEMEATPEQVRSALTRPEVADEVFSDPEARLRTEQHIARIRQEGRAAETAEALSRRTPAEREQIERQEEERRRAQETGDRAEWLLALNRIGDAIKDADRLLPEHLTSPQMRIVLSRLDEWGATFDTWRERSYGDLDAEAARLAGGAR